MFKNFTNITQDREREQQIEARRQNWVRLELNHMLLLLKLLLLLCGTIAIVVHGTPQTPEDEFPQYVTYVWGSTGTTTEQVNDFYIDVCVHCCLLFFCHSDSKRASDRCKTLCVCARH